MEIPRVDFTPEQLESRILVVDDVLSARRIVRGQLEKLGFKHIDEACNGMQAFERVAAGEVDVVVSDWMMPELDGLALLQMIRKELKQCGARFLMVTAVSEKEQVLQALGSGVSEYIIKPFGVATLAEKLRTLFAARVEAPGESEPRDKEAQ